MKNKQRMTEAMEAMANGHLRPLFELMADDVTWQWMGVESWTRRFEGKASLRDVLFGGADEHLAPSSSVVVRHVHGDGDHVVVEHQGRNELPDGRRYDNNYCWVCHFENGRITEVREYMDTQLVTDTFGPDDS